MESDDPVIVLKAQADTEIVLTLAPNILHTFAVWGK